MSVSPFDFRKAAQIGDLATVQAFVLKQCGDINCQNDGVCLLLNLHVHHHPLARNTDVVVCLVRVLHTIAGWIYSPHVCGMQWTP